jgi:20S proteasome alpha/beta subunit
MTLIIGFKCTHGVALVSDTKIIDITSGEESFAPKILRPMPQAPFIVGAAGYSDLFLEFNRKIPLIVGQRLIEYKISNIEALLRTGFTREQAINYLEQLEPRARVTQQTRESVEKTMPPIIESGTPMLIPYFYTYERFMDDCKQLIREISKQRKEETSNPLDVLIGVRKDVGVLPSLHYIDCDGHEHEVENYFAIGSGYPHVRQFFDRLYNFNNGMYDLVALAFLTITYVQKIAKESSVGYSDEFPPEAYVVFNDGRCGRLVFENEKEVLNNIEAGIKRFDDLIHDTKITKLQSKVLLPSETTIRVPRLVSGTR